LSNITYSPIHRQGGAPVIKIQSALRTASDLYKNYHSLCYLVATLIHIQPVRTQIEAGRAKEV